LRRILGTGVLLFITGLCVSAGYGQRRNIESVEQRVTPNINKVFEVYLDVDAGDVYVEGDETTSCFISMDFTKGEFRERIDFDEKRNRLKISLKKKDWSPFNKKRKGRNNDTRTHVRISLPTQVEMIVTSKIKAGEVTMEMGGLRLREFYLSTWAGEVEVEFDEPNQIEMDFMDINTRIGETRLLQLGNARFKRADINSDIGEIEVDFTGDLLAESRAKVDLDIGESTIILPRDASIQMRIGGLFSFMSEKDVDRSFYRRGGSYFSDDFDDNEKKLYLKISTGLGELIVDRD